METSDNIDKVVGGLQSFQHKVENPKKSKKAYDYKYAPLEVVIDTVKPALEDQGLSFSQSTGFDGDKITVQTIIWHESGQYIAFDKLGLPRDDVEQQSKVQSAGSAITYARRYSLSAALGIASEEDTDARSNNRNLDKTSKNKKKNNKSNKNSKISVKSIRTDIQENIDEYGNSKDISDKQHGTIKGFLNDMDIKDNEDQHNVVAKIIDREVDSIGKLSMSEAGPIVDRIFNNKQELKSLINNKILDDNNERHGDDDKDFMEIVTNIKDRVKDKDLTETKLLKWLSDRADKDFTTFDDVPEKWLQEMVKDSFWENNEKDIKEYSKNGLVKKAKEKIEDKEVKVSQVYTWFGKKNDKEYESLKEVPADDLEQVLNKEFWDENFQEIDDTIPF